MRNTAIFLIALLTFSLISPYVSYAENKTDQTLEQMDEGQKKTEKRSHNDSEDSSINVEDERDFLAHILKEDVKIYKDINDLSDSKANDSYMGTVYFVTDQITIDNQLYYLISAESNNDKSVIGWIESSHVSIQPFISVDEIEKTFYIKGSGSAYNKAWGGNGDLVLELMEYEGQKFKVNFTKMVGSDTWYRGFLNGELVWIQSNNLNPDKDKHEGQKDEVDVKKNSESKDGNAVNEQEKISDLKEDKEQTQKEKDSKTTDAKTEEKKSNDVGTSNKTLARSFAVTLKESKTSKLGHIRNSKVKIYKDIDNGSTAITAGSKYTNSVYYIKKQANVGSQLYYLISTEPSSTKGVLGWVKSQDLSTHAHVGVDKKAKTFYVKGSGEAYNTAWGGSENSVYKLSQYKDQAFKVNLTEKVGNNIWYRGLLNGRTVWIHSSYVSPMKESKTSKLGHIKNSKVKIYKNVDNESTAVAAGSKYTNSVYYIKKQANVGNQLYYLISTEPSSTRGVLGWVKSQDLSTHAHGGGDKKAKTFYVKGTGKAYDTAWGGSKNSVYNLSQYKGQSFKVHLTEKVGNNTWYRGLLNGRTVWIHSSYVSSMKESKTSKLGHIRDSKVKIYKDIDNGSTAITAGSKYTNSVYYIKKQANVGSQLYYLISTEPSSTKGVLGWVKSQDLSTYAHVGGDKKAKTFYVKGTGKAYDTAWGGSKNLVYNLSQYKGQSFKVYLTEKVGNNTWYRGLLNGRTVWIHSSYVSSMKESKTSKLGHIRNSKVKIYKDIDNGSTAITAGSKYTNSVYYIKKQANVGSQLYYLISTEPSSTKGVLGWVKSQDLSTHAHVGGDKKAKTFYIKGTGKAYDTAWGGSKNLVYNLSQYKGQSFKVHLTEKVGNNTWYRGVLNGKTVWIHESYILNTPLKEVINTYTNYNLTLNRMADIQTAVNPQTDNKYQLWIREDAFNKGSIKNGKGTISGDNWNLRRGPGTNYLTDGKVNNGTVLTLKSNAKGSDGYTWYYVRDTSGWVTPDINDLKYYLNPSNFTSNLKDSLQFLKLSESANINVAEINEKVLNGKGILGGKGQSFADGANAHGVNEIYLISHALLETGNGTSKLATGVKYKGKTVYNMYGIGANDNCPLECGSKYAYDAGWFTPELAIKGGAEFVGKNYLGVGQDTLYKMRWNPSFAADNGYATHQYASDIGWASKQTTRMYELYNLLDGYNMILDIPMYK